MNMRGVFYLILPLLPLGGKPTHIGGERRPSPSRHASHHMKAYLLVLLLAAVWGEPDDCDFKCGGWSPGSFPQGVYSCQMGCLLSPCGGGGGGGALTYGCHDAPDDACLGKYSDAKSCNADSSYSWCVSSCGSSCGIWTVDKITSSSCVMLENATAWVHSKPRWNATCANLPHV